MGKTREVQYVFEQRDVYITNVPVEITDEGDIERYIWCQREKDIYGTFITGDISINIVDEN